MSLNFRPTLPRLKFRKGNSFTIHTDWATAVGNRHAWAIEVALTDFTRLNQRTDCSKPQNANCAEFDLEQILAKVVFAGSGDQYAGREQSKSLPIQTLFQSSPNFDPLTLIGFG